LDATSLLAPNAATVIINDPALHIKLSPALLEQDLKRQVADSWDGKIKPVSSTDFLVVFPDEASLQMCKNTGGMTLPVSKVAVLFTDPKPDSSSAVVLSKIWILLSGILDYLRKAELLLEATKILGRSRMVDDDSLSQDGPVRMFFHSHNPDKLPPFILLFANQKGCKIRLSFPPSAPQMPGQFPPPSDLPTDRDKDEETED
jgi:hypothetical protein